MGNHHIECDYCFEDTRGLSGVRGCDTREQAAKCWQFKKLQAERAQREPYRSVAESCEILAAEMDDRGDKPNAQICWEADAHIRELEAENACLRKHLMDASNVFSTMGHRLRFFSLPGTQRREIADECRFRAEQFREAASDPA
ncbi:hypothetical protein ACQKQD_18200 [Methylobacterium sp. NPDC080182]|uniref:hypothetical protein n=1 Tax=Methylobacterium sp. NPDC080182 TaxID=3390590 RepID=UPI003D05DF8B